MVHHHRASLLVPHHHQQQREAGGRLRELRVRLAEYACQHRKHDDALLRMLAGFALVSCLLLLLLPGSPVSAVMDELGRGTTTEVADDGAISCDRTSPRTDVCVMRGHVRTHAASNSLLLLVDDAPATTTRTREERIRPYTRKWESSVMSTIDELRLREVPKPDAEGVITGCDVRHDVPAVVFSTGGYTGNVYHEFNDGIIPLYITARRYNRKVVLVVLEYHDWWMTKYGHIVEQLSDYPPIDFASTTRESHCFPEAVVGLRIHDELAVDAALGNHNQSIHDFRQMLDDAYRGRIQTIVHEEEEKNKDLLGEQKKEEEKNKDLLGEQKKKEEEEEEEEEEENKGSGNKPRLVIVSRGNGSRAIENEAELVRAAAATGFRVSVLQPRRDTELARIYRALNASDAMVGVHGAAMTHLLFMRPGSVFIQVVPLGARWAAETYYGEPARRLGLRYMPYEIVPSESSLYAQYAKGDPVLTDPDAVNAKGWHVTKKVYLDGQNVRLDMARFRRRLREAYAHWAAQRRQRHRQDSN